MKIIKKGRQSVIITGNATYFKNSCEGKIIKNDRPCMIITWNGNLFQEFS